MKKIEKALEKGLVYILTVGTSSTSFTSNLIDALIDDLKGLNPSRLILLATKDSQTNAERIIEGLKLKKNATKIVLLKSADSVDEAYMVTNSEITTLENEGIPASQIVLQYTSGTKVMSAGAALAAVGHEIHGLRYLLAKGKGEPSEPVTTAAKAVLADRTPRVALNLFREFRFRVAYEQLRDADFSLLPKEKQQESETLKELSLAYGEWDSFQYQEFQKHLDTLNKKIAKTSPLAEFQLSKNHLNTVKQICLSLEKPYEFPEELLVDMWNNAIRRLIERRADDAYIRLQRAGELYAQKVLWEEYQIRTDEVEIRKVPPRYRTGFEALRRFEDATIKLGFRKSYELLYLLGHPVGKAFSEADELARILDERRDLILVHGVRSAKISAALDFMAGLSKIFQLTIPKFEEEAEKNQFPWIHNSEVIAHLKSSPILKADDPLIPQNTYRNSKKKSKQKKISKPRKP